MVATRNVPGFSLQHAPAVYVASIPGKWLLAHATPSWRIQDPVSGFQRVVKSDRAEQIAWSVLDQGRSFPNAVVLATDSKSIKEIGGEIIIPEKTKFLVVDGQHRIWAQNFSDYEAQYACVIHVGLTEVQMAKLFLEINDNQKRVPSSLRWDLVRLVRPDDDPFAIAASEMVYGLTSNEESPLYQRIDLTGEQGEKDLKQGSIAPELKSVLSNKKSGIKELDFDGSYELLLRYLDALRKYDPDSWRDGKSPFLGARVMRAALRLLPDILIAKKVVSDPLSVSVDQYLKLIKKIPAAELELDAIRAHQGAAGIKHIYEQMRQRVLA